MYVNLSFVFRGSCKQKINQLLKKEKFLAYGMDDYLDKSVDKDELLEVIERNVAK